MLYDTLSSSDKLFQALSRHRAWTTESQSEQQSNHLLLTTAVRTPFFCARGAGASRMTSGHSKNVDEIIKQNGYQHKKKKKNEGGTWHVVGTQCVLVP